ncbi:hypothetical protein [Kordia sp.]|uniref:hypothetical protein n=1 Tax=Kordia sp. TaxID=1965332 RepID=UPI003D2677C6
MKKQNLKSLELNKKLISNLLGGSITGNVGNLPTTIQPITLIASCPTQQYTGCASEYPTACMETQTPDCYAVATGQKWKPL